MAEGGNLEGRGGFSFWVWKELRVCVFLVIRFWGRG